MNVAIVDDDIIFSRTLKKLIALFKKNVAVQVFSSAKIPYLYSK